MNNSYRQAFIERKEVRHLPSGAPDVRAWTAFFGERVEMLTRAAGAAPGTSVEVNLSKVQNEYITPEFLRETFGRLVLASKTVDVSWVTHLGQVLTKEQFIEFYKLQDA